MLLAQGTHDLGEGDEPLNSWTFGDRAEELFEYRLVRQRRVQSGEGGVL